MNREAEPKNELGLTGKEAYCLMYLAYSGEKGHYLSPVPASPSGIRISSSELDRMLERMARQEWLQEFGMNFRNGGDIYTISPKRHVEVLKMLVANHPQLLAHFRKTVSQTYWAQYLTEVAEILCGTKETIEKDYNRSQFTQDNFMRVIASIVVLREDERFGLLLQKIAPSILEGVVNHLIYEAEENLDVPLLETVGEALDNRAKLTPELERISSIQRRDYFYLTGEELPMRPYEKGQAARYYLDAAKALYEDRVDEAIGLYKEGLKAQNKIKEIKNIPQDPMTLLLYTIALGRRYTEEDRNTLRQMYDKRKKGDLEQRLRANFALIEYMKDRKAGVGIDFLPELVKKDSAVSPVQKCMARMILRYLGEGDEKDSTERWEPYETELEKIRVRPRWEVELADLIADAGGEVTEDNQPTEEHLTQRLCYIFSPYRDQLEVREQNRLKSGEWGKGKVLSMRKYRDGDCSMDRIDRQIHDAWEKGDPYYRYTWGREDAFPSPQLAFPYLKGTDKMLEGTHWSPEPITVTEELPYIMADRGEKYVTFRTNVPEEALKQKGGVPYQLVNRNLVYYPMDKSSRALFDRLLKMEKVPVAAEPMLEQLFRALQGKVEVQSTIAGGVQMEEVDGSDTMILQMKPWRQMYECRLLVRPLKGGQKLCLPARGEETIVDVREGVRYQVKRYFYRERKNKKRLLDLLHAETSIVSDLSQTGYATMSDVIRILELASENEGLFVVEWPEGQKVTISKPDTSTWQVNAQAQGGWFELEGELRLDEQHVVSIGQLLGMLRESEGKYIRLSASDYVLLGEKLRRQLARIDSVAQESRGHVRVPELAMAVAGEALQGEMEIMVPEQVVEMRRRIRESEQVEVAVPDTLNATLRDYQEDGYRWMMRLMHWGAGACLADDMGLGKTVQTIACLLAHNEEGAQMVVAPASVVGNWQRELARFAPSLTVFMLNEVPAADREEYMEHAGAGDVLVMTYGLLVTEREALVAREWTTICLDEAHTIKNRDTKSSAAAMQMRAQNRIILTGTPIQNHLGELWNLMQFINPGLLGSYEHFSEKFMNPIAAGEQEAKLALKRLIAPFMLRRTKQEVARELPDKEDILVPVRLSDEEMAVYEVIRREAKAELEAGSQLSVNALAMITKLREAACSAALAEKNWTGGSSKLDALTDKLLPIVEGGNRVLIFSQFTSFLTMAKETLKAAGLTDFFYLDGSTPIRERQRMVEDFQKGKKQVFIISLKAGGLGLNLTGANYVIHLDPWWNPAIEQQATDRAYRIGQQQKVTVYHLIAEQTIEEKILRLHETKRSLADSLLEGTDMSHKLTAKDLLELIEERLE